MSLSPTAPTQGSMLHPKCHSHGSPAAHTFPTNGSLGKKFTASLPSLMGFPNQILLFKQPGSNLKPEVSCARCLDESHLKNKHIYFCANSECRSDGPSLEEKGNPRRVMHTLTLCTAELGPLILRGGQ